MNISQAISSLPFDVELDDDEMVSDALILAKVTRMSDGRSTFVLAGSDGLDTVTRTGLVECARQVNGGDWERVEDEE